MTKNNRWAQLCALKVKAFNDPRWRWERKLDGDRMSVLVTDNGSTSLLSRSGVDKTDKFPEIRLVVPESARPMMLDGEVVSATGLSFQEWNQRRMNRKSGIGEIARELPGKFVAFDILMVGGKDLGGNHLVSRRDWLEKVAPCEITEQVEDGVALFERAKAEGWEGVVGKDLSLPYQPHRRTWVKVKVWLEPREYYVVGFTEGTGKRKGQFGALMIGKGLGCYDGVSQFEYVCDVGTGLTDAELARLDVLRREMPAYRGLEFGQRVLEEYATGPLLRVMVKAVEKTNDGKLRFPVYCGQVT